MALVDLMGDQQDVRAFLAGAPDPFQGAILEPSSMMMNRAWMFSAGWPGPFVQHLDDAFFLVIDRNNEASSGVGWQAVMGFSF